MIIISQEDSSTMVFFEDKTFSMIPKINSRIILKFKYISVSKRHEGSMIFGSREAIYCSGQNLWQSTVERILVILSKIKSSIEKKIISPAKIFSNFLYTWPSCFFCLNHIRKHSKCKYHLQFYLYTLLISLFLRTGHFE